jgi:HPt (histidine-containing phosphotransfer) domain-containing protein
MTRTAWIRIAQNIGTLLCTLGFIFALAGVTYYTNAITQRSAAEAIRIDASERLRMLSQRIPELLYTVQTDIAEKQKPEEDLSNLLAASDQFGSELNAFVKGGTLTDAGGAQLSVDPLGPGTALAAAQQAQAVWTPLSHSIDRLKAGQATALADAVTKSRMDQATLLDQTTALSVAVRGAAQRALLPLSRPRDILAIVGVAAFIFFVGLLFLRVQEGQREIEGYAVNLEDANVELDSRSRQLADAKAGTDLILNTVTQGLLLIDSSYAIMEQHSQELRQILRIEHPAGSNFLSLMQRILTEKMYNTTRDYLGLLFDPTKRERAVAKVNPLDEVEVNFPSSEGGFVSRNLGFTFRRIYDGKMIPQVFVAVTDITARIQLEKKLRESELLKKRQFELLLSILHVDPLQLDEFVQAAEEQIRQMNAALKAEDIAPGARLSSEVLRERLNTVFRCVHSIKGNAAFLHLDYFQDVAEQFETKLSELRNMKTLGGEDFLPIVVAQSDLKSDVEELKDLREKLVGIHRVVSAPVYAPPPSQGELVDEATQALQPGEPAQRDDIVAGVEGLARALALKLGKEVAVESDGFDTREVSPERRPMLRDVLIQLTRNSLAHGVEDPKERQRLGKPPYATITIRKRESVPNNWFGFTFRDDGQGLDPVKIRARAVESGLLTIDQARGIDDSQLASLIFAPGFSTANGATGEAGRGMGMDIIKQRVVDEWGGEISVQAVPGRFCEFSFLVPK